ncbi:Lon family ATP-dependent protease [Ferroacidibacillus organovorans]|uniref:endopeptidase La n=1 Tax=Ferroacidibacillus organovorans TaxID=1765683 RepID=A0A101XS69_9BACL|nr:Lon family ATP-dependent protease [Ferroacidibacillus organovorans]KUO96551.1 hypothetical protein ATW55_00230 [Ferroacidibacillus organovorans]
MQQKRSHKDSVIVEQAAHESMALRDRLNSLLIFAERLYGKEAWDALIRHYQLEEKMRSTHLEQRVSAFYQLFFQKDPSLRGSQRDFAVLPAMLGAIEEKLVEQAARKKLDEQLDEKVASELERRHLEYLEQIRKEILLKNKSAESPHSLRMYGRLEKMARQSMGHSLFSAMRPSRLEQIVGQRDAIRSLLAKMCSPWPQHVLLYGPPGVGKTTVARLVMREAANYRRSRFYEDSPFVELDATSLRGNQRDATDPLLGFVQDPIYQGTRHDFAGSGVPEPKLGAVSEAHGGVLFIDEIGEMEPHTQLKLLKVLEDKKVSFQSAYYDAADSAVPLYIKRLFEEGAPADFILIGATTRQPEEINPALRSRCAEIFFDALTTEDLALIVKQSAEQLGTTLEPDAATKISQSAPNGRKAVGLLGDAYALASLRTGADSPEIALSDVQSVLRVNRMASEGQVPLLSSSEIGRVFALGVHQYVGRLIEIEAAVFPAREPHRGEARVNDRAGLMTKDALQNALTNVRRVFGEAAAHYDLHVNVVGGGIVDGPSAGLAFFVVLMSVLTDTAIPQDVAFTGELSIRGEIKAVGGVPEKLNGARHAGVRTLYIPSENRLEIAKDLSENVRFVSHVRDILTEFFPKVAK